jgi:hypothetical protein
MENIWEEMEGELSSNEELLSNEEWFSKQKFVPYLGLSYKYPCNFLMAHTWRNLAETHGYLNLGIKPNPKSRTGIEISFGTSFFNKYVGITLEFDSMCTMEPKCTSFGATVDKQYVVSIQDIDACYALVTALDAYEQEDIKERYPMLSSRILMKPQGQISLDPRYTSQYKFWRGYLEFLVYLKSSKGDPANQLDGGVVSKPLIYLGFMYFVQNIVLSKGYVVNPEKAWKKVLETRNTIIKNFKPLEEDSFANPAYFMFDYNPPFGKNDIPEGKPRKIHLTSYHGPFFNGLDLAKKDEFFKYYDDFFAGKFPTNEVPPVPYPDD